MDPTRLRILHLLCGGESCFGDLVVWQVEAAGFPPPPLTRSGCFWAERGTLTLQTGTN
ncbi:MAG: ArsR family transcriptional regulator [Thermoanaerobaculia bacterium]